MKKFFASFWRRNSAVQKVNGVAAVENTHPKVLEVETMDIRVISSGKIFYKIDNALGFLLVESFPNVFAHASAAPTKHNPPSPVVPAVARPTFVVRQQELNGDWLIRFNNGLAWTEDYFGPPEGAAAYFQKIGFPVPENVLERYAQLKPTDLTEAKVLTERHRQDAEIAARAKAAGISMDDIRANR